MIIEHIAGQFSKKYMLIPIDDHLVLDKANIHIRSLASEFQTKNSVFCLHYSTSKPI